MRLYVVSILYISLVVLFFECITIFKNMKTSLHKYLFLCCGAMLVNNLGYLLGIQTTDVAGRIMAVKFSYAGRVWIAYGLLMFAVELCHINFPARLKRFLLFTHAFIYLMVLTIGRHPFYYTYVNASLENNVLTIRHGCGVFYYLLMVLQLIYIIFGFYWLLTTYFRQKNAAIKRCFILVISAIMIQSSFFIVQIAGVLPISKMIDISVIGNVILAIFLYIAIVRCNLLEVSDIAKDFIIDRLSQGVVAVDNLGKVRYYNQLARHLYPGLVDSDRTILNALLKASKEESEIDINNRIYTVEENELTNDFGFLGTIYTIVDSTDLKENEYKLKADAKRLQMAAKKMKDQLLITEEFVKQDRRMRHDRRHFEALLMTMLQDGNVEDAKKALSEHMANEPPSTKRYCENAAVNAAFLYYICVAEKHQIKVNANIDIPADLGIDDLQLSIAIANLMENAIRACNDLKADARWIDIKGRYKSQLLLEISNSCQSNVSLNEEGLPFSNEAGHGIGTKSVVAFVNEAGGFIEYISEENAFKVRMML